MDNKVNPHHDTPCPSDSEEKGDIAVFSNGAPPASAGQPPAEQPVSGTSQRPAAATEEAQATRVDQDDEATVGLPGGQGEGHTLRSLPHVPADDDWGHITREVFAPVQLSVPASGDSGFIPRPTGVGRFRIVNNFRLLRRAILELSGRMEQLQAAIQLMWAEDDEDKESDDSWIDRDWS